MTEWIDVQPARFFDHMLHYEYIVDSLLIDHSREATLAISDDRPVNEFYLLRGLAARGAPPPTEEGTTPPDAAAPR